MPLLRWGWKEIRELPTSKSEANAMMNVPTYWSTLGPAGCERMSKMFRKGRIGTTCYLTVAALTSIKVTLYWKCRAGLVLTRTSGVGVPILAKAPMDELERSRKRSMATTRKVAPKALMKRPTKKPAMNKNKNAKKMPKKPVAAMKRARKV